MISTKGRIKEDELEVKYLTEKYLFSIEVEPYNPNRQFIIINRNGGEPLNHFQTQGAKGLLVARISFEDVNKLQYEFDWIEDVQKGYYAVLNELKG
jgi:hypothetical protein